MTGAIVETAYAKINLALHVRRRRDDGYHEIETIFAFCEDGDELSVQPSDSLSLDTSGPFAGELAGESDNLVLRAAHALRDAAGVVDGALLRLVKNLPVAAGIGGGSADAAAALRLLIRFWGVNPAHIDFPALAVSLGADVPACIASVTMVGTGVGARLEPVDIDVGGMPVLLVNPGVACPTGPVFRAWDGVDRGALDPADWRSVRNDLELPARALVPQVGAVLAALSTLPGATISRMSGSGATCFALFDDEGMRDAAHHILQAAHPHWWTMASILR